MLRRTAVLIAVCMLSAAAHAQGNDIIVVEPTPSLAAEAANTDAEDALTPKNRNLLIRMVSYGCTRKARTTPEFITLSEKHGGKDVAKGYCECFTGEMISHLKAEHIKTIIKTRKPDPQLQAELQPVAQACIDEATR